MCHLRGAILFVQKVVAQIAIFRRKASHFLL
jgi:hypothetical protein